MDSKLGDLESYVTFVAYLKQGYRDASFQEISRFLKENNEWLYIEGIISTPP